MSVRLSETLKEYNASMMSCDIVGGYWIFRNPHAQSESLITDMFAVPLRPLPGHSRPLFADWAKVKEAAADRLARISKV